MAFHTLNFDQPSVIGGKFFATAFFDNGLGVHVHADFAEPNLFHVSAVRGSRAYWEVDFGINNACSLGVHQAHPMYPSDVEFWMNTIEAR